MNLIFSFYLFLMNLLTWLFSLMFLILKFNMMIEWNIFNMNSFKMEFIIYIDWMSLMFINTVCLISSMVMIYSISYMKNEKFIKRFMLLIMIFVTSMILMIISPNMLSILLGWDGLGLSSYCLVAFYYSKKSFNASMITILMNRVGDIMILMMISLMLTFGSWNFLLMIKMKHFMMMLIITAAITKSAQIPFSSWLPLAMAAPTPVSSLVHSSTLVTAGVYLLIRFNHLMNKEFMFFLMMLSCLTMLMAGSSANMEFDFKKIIALSTLSQLGLMIMTISLNMVNFTFFHLISHAMFKSLLFLCSGIIIHNYFNNQDIRNISFIFNNLPFINMVLNIASLTLCGMPFLTGFYSKDLIIEIYLMSKINWIIMFMMFVSMGLTMSYTSRLMYYISMKNMKMPMMNYYKSMNLMNYSIIILLLFSMFYGSMMNWLMFNSMNLIILPKMLKTFIYLILIISMILGIMLPKIMMIYLINKKMIYLMFFFNSMWFLSNMISKMKINIFKFNFKYINYMETSWNELMLFEPFLFYIKFMFKMKNIYKLNFLLMFMSISYLILIN